MTQNRSRLTEHANQSLGSYELVLAALVFGAVGFWIDRRLDVLPAFTIGLTLLGFVGAGLGIYYRYRDQIAKLQAETAELRAAARANNPSAAAGDPDTATNTTGDTDTTGDNATGDTDTTGDTATDGATAAATDEKAGS